MSLKEIKERHEHLVKNQIDEVLKDKIYADKESIAYAFDQAHQDRAELLRLIDELIKIPKYIIEIGTDPYDLTDMAKEVLAKLD